MDNKNELLNNLHRFKLPEISLDGVEIIGLNVIHRDDINDEMFDNGARTQDNLSARSNTLQTSFINGGYDYNQPVGIVSDRGDGKYDRLDSFARSDAFMKLGWDYMVYCIVKCENELSETSVRMWANRMIPKTDNTQNDLVQNAVSLIQKKLILNDATSIREWLKSVEPNRDSAFIEKCLITIQKKAKTNKPNEVTQTYTDTSIHSKWIKKHWANPPVYGFIKSKGDWPYNPAGNCYQVTLPLGYESRKLLTALKYFVETDKKTEFILHISKGVSDLQTLHTQRDKMRNNIKDFTENLDKFYGKKGDWNKCFKILGFVPQHRTEDVKQIIPF
jgi:hypothetical protein